MYETHPHNAAMVMAPETNTGEAQAHAASVVIAPEANMEETQAPLPAIVVAPEASLDETPATTFFSVQVESVNVITYDATRFMTPAAAWLVQAVGHRTCRIGFLSVSYTLFGVWGVYREILQPNYYKFFIAILPWTLDWLALIGQGVGLAVHLCFVSYFRFSQPPTIIPTQNTCVPLSLFIVYFGIPFILGFANALPDQQSTGGLWSLLFYFSYAHFYCYVLLAHLATTLLMRAEFATVSVQVLQALESGSATEVDAAISVFSSMKLRWKCFLIAIFCFDGLSFLAQILMDYLFRIKPVSVTKVVLLSSPLRDAAFLLVQVTSIADYNDKITHLQQTTQSNDVFRMCMQHAPQLQFSLFCVRLTRKRLLAITISAVLSQARYRNRLA